MTKRSIQDAAFLGKRKQVMRCIERGDDLNELDEEGFAALHWAIQEGYLRIVELLLDHGADVNLPNQDGMSPLHIALYDQKTDIALLLIKRGAHLDLDEHGFSALHLVAGRGGNKKVLRKLSQNVELLHQRTDDGEGVTPLHYAAQEGKSKKVQLLLEAGAEVDAVGLDGFTPLYLAVGNNHPKAVKVLLKAGADIEAENVADGDTAVLALASAYGYERVVRLLLSYGADPLHRNEDGRTARDAALDNEHHQIAEILRQKEIDALSEEENN